jgi:hypothetical protein
LINTIFTARKLKSQKTKRKVGISNPEELQEEPGRKAEVVRRTWWESVST